MKILQVINTLDTGGAERLLIDSIPLFIERGIKMDILVLKKFDSLFLQQLIEFNCCNIYFLNTFSIYNPLIVFKILPFFLKYDIIHVHLFPAQYWAAFAKFLSFSNIKLIFTEHSTKNRRRNNFFTKFIDRIVYTCYNKVICISQSVENELIKLGLPSKKITVIENGINLNNFIKVKPIDKSKINSKIYQNDKLLIQVSRFGIEKDQKTLIKAMTLLPNNYKLILVGDGDLLEELKSFVITLQIENRIVFLGNRIDIPVLLASSDLSIQSSKWEGFGIAAVEAMAIGKPVIASDVPGLSEVVYNAGLLFKCGDYNELAKIISDILSDSNQERYRYISELCKSRSFKYDINFMIDKYISQYQNLLIINTLLCVASQVYYP